MATDLVKLIREKYSKTVPIVLRVDSGFFDGDNFSGFDKLGIAFIGAGKIYKSIKEYVKSSSWIELSENSYLSLIFNNIGCFLPDGKFGFKKYSKKISFCLTFNFDKVIMILSENFKNRSI